VLVTDAASIKERFLTTGCSRLDAKFGGGIPCRGITQIYGAGGTGKTQLALQLCLTVQLPITAGGLEAGNVRKVWKKCIMTYASLRVNKRLSSILKHYTIKFLTCI